MLQSKMKLTRTLCVRNISDSVTYDDIYNEFSKYGTITDIVMPVDYVTKMSKGYIFVEYEDFAQAEDAYYSLHLTDFCGNKIAIDFAKNDWKKEIQLREQLQFLKYSFNVDVQKIMCIHVLNMSGI